MDNSDNKVYLECIRSDNRLRVRIISKNYNNDAFCRFPKIYRKNGRHYAVPPSAIKIINGKAGGIHYSIKKSSIEILDDIDLISVLLEQQHIDLPEKVYKSDECCICLEGKCDKVFVDCGHLCVCDGCMTDKLIKCPLCRRKIIERVSIDRFN